MTSKTTLETFDGSTAERLDCGLNLDDRTAD